MTFGIGFVHPAYAGVVTDRRLSVDGTPTNEAYEKAGLVEFSNARLAYTFSGLAGYLDFDAATWIAMGLAEAGSGGVKFHVALARFAAMCTSRIGGLGITKAQKRKFSVLFAGYELAQQWSVSRFAMVSNVRKLSLESGTEIFYEPFGDFEVTYQQTSPVRCLAASIGGGRFREDDLLVRKLEERFTNDKTTAADAVNVAVRLIRDNANAVIGSDCSSIIVPSDFGDEPKVNYHPNHASNDLKFPSFVQASHGAKGAGFAMNGVTRYAGEPANPPIAAAPDPVHKRAKCWCGSGLTFGDCHGARGFKASSVPVGTTEIHHGFDTRELAPAAGGAHFWLPPYLFYPGTTMDQYKITNMRTGEVAQEPSSESGR